MMCILHGDLGVLKVVTCGECKATQTMRASEICKECEEADKPLRMDGADGF